MWLGDESVCAADGSACSSCVSTGLLRGAPVPASLSKGLSFGIMVQLTQAFDGSTSCLHHSTKTEAQAAPAQAVEQRTRVAAEWDLHVQCG